MIPKVGQVWEWDGMLVEILEQKGAFSDSYTVKLLEDWEGHPKGIVFSGFILNDRIAKCKKAYNTPLYKTLND